MIVPSRQAIGQNLLKHKKVSHANQVHSVKCRFALWCLLYNESKGAKEMKTIFKYKLIKDYIKRYENQKRQDKVILSILEEMLADYEVELINEQIALGNEVVKSIKGKKKGGGKK